MHQSLRNFPVPSAALADDCLQTADLFVVSGPWAQVYETCEFWHPTGQNQYIL
jgi:hypothetical protein